MTIREGLSAKELGIRDLILEGDAKIVIESFEDSSMDLSHNGLVLIDAIRLASWFRFFKSQYI